MNSTHVPSKKASLYIIIPLLNEEDNVSQLLKSIENLQRIVKNEFDIKLVLVDDGSQDNTISRAETCNKSLPLKILRHYKNIGPGAAFANGFSYLSTCLNDDDWVITMEGDNTSNIETINHMLLRRKEGYEIVLASPYLYSGSFSNVNFIRITLSQVANTLVKYFLGIDGIFTFSCFLRLYSGEIILKAQALFGTKIIKSQGFEAMVELLAKFAHMKARISEVETSVNWNNRAGKSKLKVLKTSLGYFKLFLNWRSLSKPAAR